MDSDSRDFSRYIFTRDLALITSGTILALVALSRLL